MNKLINKVKHNHYKSKYQQLGTPLVLFTDPAFRNLNPLNASVALIQKPVN